MERVYHAIDLVYAHTVEFALQQAVRMLQQHTSHDSHHVVLPKTPEVIELPGEQSKADAAPQSFKSVGVVMHERGTTEDLTKTIAYVGSSRAPVWTSPTKEFDTVRTALPYGTMAMVLEEKGRFSRVLVGENEGWVLRDDLSDRAAYVYPEFVVGEENGSEDPNTLRLRAVIQDEFHAGEAELPLQAGEYVVYKLIRKGKVLEWPAERPRIPGRWRQILRGRAGIRIGIAPKVGSILECTLEHDMGHLAYVEAVFPGERITISEVNFPDRGIYNERTLSKEEWQVLNPVFIEVN